MADGNSWDRQPNESAKAYEAFCVYRDLGEIRGLSKVGQKLHKSKTLIGRWSARRNWAARVRDYDVYLEQQLRRENEEERKAMARRHATIATGMLNRVTKRLNELLLREQQGTPIPELTMDQIARWVETAVKTERLSRGEPSEHQAISGPSVNVQVEWHDADGGDDAD